MINTIMLRQVTKSALNIKPLKSIRTVTTRPLLNNLIKSNVGITSRLLHTMQYKPVLFTNTPITNRNFYGPVSKLILDWSGTTADIYVNAPADAFIEVFALPEFDIKITNKQARKPMGNHKRTHIKKILLEDPEVTQQWRDKHGRDPTEADVDAIFAKFTPLQVNVLTNEKYTKLVPNLPTVIKTLKQKFNLEIGTTTGFTRLMVDKLLADATKQGYSPKVNVAADEVPRSRPWPDSMWMNNIKLGAEHYKAVVKAGDTLMDIEEGNRAGAITIGLARYNNWMGEQFDDPSNIDKMEKENPEEFKKLLIKSRNYLATANPHYVVDTMEDVPAVIEDINRRLSRGENMNTGTKIKQ
jgi:phosphonoacetaldehyde hydrolase